MTIQTAIIGLGIMGRRMLEHMVLHADYNVVAVWDPDAASCELARELAPDARIGSSAEDAMAGADLVYLACPPEPRKAYALKAAAAGTALFLEKPLGVDVEESRALVDAVAASGVPAAVNFTQAAGPALAEVTAAAQSGNMGDLAGADIILSYAHWPREWQKTADWLRFSAEGGMTREVISHFIFFSERLLGPLNLVWAQTDYPAQDNLCETHVAARLISASGKPVSIMGSVGGAQPDRQELTIKGSKESRRVTEFYKNAASDGGEFTQLHEDYADPRALSLKAQLDDLSLMMAGKTHRLATLEEALRVQVLVEAILANGTPR
ncbi:Oxidoreductase family, NAD-binding Rossmann fold protein [Sulfitobacter noctilucicola]|uniref:Putative dehydrogenase n=1 Tax=Sulfitobacter noctilucicola TaxID=1342301 RepID=A0A7W6MC00_9RHOB|nr:Gfo/Idh/MocA family oxidoreductase [Sulfitobacter noctilucicola]KIN64073.1 Oxidoreductase family, NAD-binding Rossmann fold protein [Sulfitobacter noctilucicola]MBB4175427.1 putative dehydrogenase [Sulfitobacter noctilucicola]